MEYFCPVKGTLKHDISAIYKYVTVKNINIIVGVSRNLPTWSREIVFWLHFQMEKWEENTQLLWNGAYRLTLCKNFLLLKCILVYERTQKGSNLKSKISFVYLPKHIRLEKLERWKRIFKLLIHLPRLMFFFSFDLCSLE